MVDVGLVVFGGLLLASLFLWWRSSSSEESQVIDVRETPQRRIEQLTVEELHERAQELLIDEGYRMEGDIDQGDYLAYRDDEVSLVRVDPAAEYNDPRKMNQMILQIRKSDAESGVVVTTRSVDGKSRSLASEGSVRIIEPKQLLDSTENNTGDSE